MPLENIPDNAEVEEALKTDLSLLRPVPFAATAPFMQLLLTIRLIYEDPLATRNLMMGLSSYQQSVLAGLAAYAVAERDPIVRAVKPETQFLLDTLSKTLSSRKLPREKDTVLKTVEAMYGKPVADVMRNCETVRFVANLRKLHRQAREQELSRRDPKLTDQSPEETGLYLEYAEALTDALSLVPYDFCAQARAIAEERASSRGTGRGSR